MGACATCGRRVPGRRPLQPRTRSAPRPCRSALRPPRWSSSCTKASSATRARRDPAPRSRGHPRDPRARWSLCVHEPRPARRRPTTRCVRRSAAVRSSVPTRRAGTSRARGSGRFATADATVYAMRPGRGFEDAARSAAKRFGGVLVRDGWVPYRTLRARRPFQRASRISGADRGHSRSIIRAAPLPRASSTVSTRRSRCVPATRPVQCPPTGSPSHAADGSTRRGICSPARDPAFPPSGASSPI